MKNIKCKKCKSEDIYMYYNYSTMENLDIGKLTLSEWIDKNMPNMDGIIFQCESCSRNNYNIEKFETKEELLNDWIEV